MGETRTVSRRLPRVTEEHIAACRTPEGLVRALGILGLINAAGDAVNCPKCGKASDLKKFSIKPDGGFKHFGADGCWGGKGSGIDLLVETLNLSFPDAVRALTGQPTSVEVPIPDRLPEITVNTFKATIDPEVYQGILNYGRRYNNGEGLRAAQDFYGQWHISPEAVAESGAVYITDPDALADALIARYGLNRLLAAGVFTMTKNDTPMCLISRKWPVIEPARNTRGDVVNLQFRASNAQYARYLRHKAKELPYEGNQKFLNVRGVDPGTIGIDAAAQLPAGSQVFIVEGFKDRLAGLTLGGSYLAFPGTGHRPSADEVEVLRRLKVVLMFDGDDAGQRAINGVARVDENGRPVLDEHGNPVLAKPGMVHWLREHGVTDLYVHPLSGDMDITDQLVAKHTRNGCGCPECAKMRTRLGL